MITPIEIEEKEFSRSRKGYDPVEVDAFLDSIILDIERLLRENEQLRRDNGDLSASLTEYKKSESSVINTLESAKKLMNDISESAEKRAEAIMKNAHLDAETITRDAKESISSLTDEGARLRERVARLKGRYKQLLEDELAHVDDYAEELISDLDKEFMPASMEKTINGSAEIPAVSDDDGKKTMVIEKSLEEMIMEDMKTSPKDDMTKTRVI